MPFYRSARKWAVSCTASLYTASLYTASLCGAAMFAGSFLLPQGLDAQQSSSRLGTPSRFVSDSSARQVDASSIPRNQLRWRTPQHAPTTATQNKSAVATTSQATQSQATQSQAATSRAASGSGSVQHAAYYASPTEMAGQGNLSLNQPAGRQTLDGNSTARVAPIQDPFGDQQPAARFTPRSNPGNDGANPGNNRAGSIVAQQQSPAANTSDQTEGLQWQSASGAQSPSARQATPVVETGVPATTPWTADPLPSSSSRIRPIRQVAQQGQGRAIDCDTARDILNGSPLTAIDLNVTPFRAEITSDASAWYSVTPRKCQR